MSVDYSQHCEYHDRMTNTQTFEFTIGDRLRKARKNARVSVGDMAQRVGCSRNTITSYEAGRTSPPVEAVVAYYQATKCDLEWLVGVEGADNLTCFLSPPGRGQLSLPLAA